MATKDNRTINQKIEDTKHILELAEQHGWTYVYNTLGGCKIGIVWLPVPPYQISITDINGTIDIPTIRTPGSPKLKSGKREIRIDLVIFFPSLYDINTRLRPLIAQFIRSPFVPIENRHIRSIILPDVYWEFGSAKKRDWDYFIPLSDRTVYERIVSKNMRRGIFVQTEEDEMDSIVAGYRKYQDSRSRHVKIFAEELRKRVEQLKHLPPLSEKDPTYGYEFKLDSKFSIYADLGFDYQFDLSLTKYPVFSDVTKEDVEKRRILREEIIQRIEELHDAILEMRDAQLSSNFDEYLIERLKLHSRKRSIYEDRQLAVALHDITISSVPGFPEALQCNLSLSCFNYDPYSKDFAFVKNVDDAIRQAEYYYSKQTMQYPKDVRDIMGMPTIYKKPHIKTTLNLSESEPFLYYLAPLLTGQDIFLERKVSMETENAGIDPIKRSIRFVAPHNWLRNINNVNEYKTFSIEYVMSEISDVEREHLRNLDTQINADIIRDLDLLLSGMKIEISNGKRIWNQLQDFLDLLIRVVSFQMAEDYGARLVKSLESYSDLDHITIKVDYPILPQEQDSKLDIPWKWIDNARTVGVIQPHRYYTLREFLDIFENLRTKEGISGWMILDKIRQRMKSVSLQQYGRAYNYTFSFTEDEDTVIAGMNATMGNKNAVIPLLGSSLPTMQHMGRSDWRVTMNIQTCNIALLRILSSLAMKTQQNRIHRDLSKQPWFIAKEEAIYLDPNKPGNGFFKLLGINHVLIEGFQYESIKEKPGWFNVVVQFVQADVNLFFYEALLPANFYDEHVVDSVREEIKKNYVMWSKSRKRTYPFAYGDKDRMIHDPFYMTREFPYLSTYIYPEIRTFIMRQILDVFYGGEYKTIPSEYLSRDMTEYEVARNQIEYVRESSKLLGFDAGDVDARARKRLREIEKKKLDKVVATIASDEDVEEIMQGDLTTDSLAQYIEKKILPRLYPDKKAEMDISISDLLWALRNKRPFEKTKAVYTLPDGKKVQLSEILERLNKIIGLRITSRRIFDIPATEALNENARRLIVEYLFQIWAERLLMIAPNEAYKLLEKRINRRTGKPFTRDDMFPMSKMLYSAKNQLFSEMYSNYFDLGLPYYMNGILSTPADFFFISYNGDDIFSNEYVQSHILSISRSMDEFWKMQYIHGFVLLDKYKEGLKSHGIEYELSTVDELRARKSKLLLERFNIANAIETAKNATVVYGSVKADKTSRFAEQEKRLRIIDSELTEIEQRIQKALEGKSLKSMVVRTQTGKIDVKNLVEFSKRIAHLMDVNMIKTLTPEQQKELVAHRSEFDFKNAMILLSCVKIASLGSALDKVDDKGNPFTGLDAPGDRMLTKLYDQITQLQMLLDTPPEAIMGSVTPWGLWKLQDIYNKVIDNLSMQKSKDKTRSMARAFPTCRLYFIEEDSRSWAAIDDYYLYNPIVSVQVHSHADSASKVAQIVITNLSENLFDASALNRKEALIKSGTLAEQSILSLYLQEGTTIMLRAGYDANPEFLDVIFYGKIVSIQYGPQVVIEAQSFGAELQEVVHNGMSKHCGYFSPCRTHGDVILDAVNSMTGLGHFGSYSILESLGIISGSEINVTTQTNRFFDNLRRYHPLLDFYFRNAVYDPRFENIYLPFSKLSLNPVLGSIVNVLFPERFEYPDGNPMICFPPLLGLLYPLDADIHKKELSPFAKALLNVKVTKTKHTPLFSKLDELWKKKNTYDLFWRSTFDWAIPENTTLWNLLKEISLYHEDYIVTTLPYNQFIQGKYRETIYVGPRNGLYKFTDLFDNKENREQLQKDLIDQRFIRNLLSNQDLVKGTIQFKELFEIQHGRKPNFFDYFKDDDPYKEIKYTSPNRRINMLYREYARLENQIAEIDQTLKDRHAGVFSFHSKQSILNQRKILFENAQRIKKILKESGYGKDLDVGHIEGSISNVSQTLGMIPSRMSPDQEDRDITRLDTGNILFSISNPHDLLKEEYVNGKSVMVPKYKGYTNVVNYYYVDSYSHIISNDIQASSAEIYNRVILKYPSDPTVKQTNNLHSREFLADDNIRGDNVKTIAVTQNNIDPFSFPLVPNDLLFWHEMSRGFAGKYRKTYGYFPRIYTVGNNILANMMRPMYRGTLTLIGMPYVKPYDIIFINDFQNQIFGPIEVESVVHSYSAEGFTTTIVPRAIVSTMDPSRNLELALMKGMRVPLFGFNLLNPSILGIKMRDVGTGALVLGHGAFALSLMGVGLSPWMVALPISTGVATLVLSFSLWMRGISKIMSRDLIFVSGLWKGAYPMVAGLNGMYKDDITIHMIDETRFLFDISGINELIQY